MTDQTEVTRWARIVAQAYAEASRPRLTDIEEEWLAEELETPLVNCILLAILPTDWAQSYVNEALDVWEALARRRSGPRLQAVDYKNGRVRVR